MTCVKVSASFSFFSSGSRTCLRIPDCNAFIPDTHYAIFPSGTSSASANRVDR